MPTARLLVQNPLYLPHMTRHMTKVPANASLLDRLLSYHPVCDKKYDDKMSSENVLRGSHGGIMIIMMNVQRMWYGCGMVFP